MLYKAVLLDLDGTVRHTHGKLYPTKVDEVHVYSDVLPKLRPYKAKDYLILGVSNQAPIGMGEISKDTAKLIMHRTNELLDFIFDEIAWCPHRPDEDCSCRKPKPGLIFYLAHKHNLDLKECLMVGDMESDRGAAMAAGVPFKSAQKFFERKEQQWKK